MIVVVYYHHQHCFGERIVSVISQWLLNISTKEKKKNKELNILHVKL